MKLGTFLSFLSIFFLSVDSRPLPPGWFKDTIKDAFGCQNCLPDVDVATTSIAVRAQVKEAEDDVLSIQQRVAARNIPSHRRRIPITVEELREPGRNRHALRTLDTFGAERRARQANLLSFGSGRYVNRGAETDRLDNEMLGHHASPFSPQALPGASSPVADGPSSPVPSPFKSFAEFIGDGRE